MPNLGKKAKYPRSVGQIGGSWVYKKFSLQLPTNRWGELLECKKATGKYLKHDDASNGKMDCSCLTCNLICAILSNRGNRHRTALEARASTLNQLVGLPTIPSSSTTIAWWTHCREMVRLIQQRQKGILWIILALLRMGMGVQVEQVVCWE